MRNRPQSNLARVAVTIRIDWRFVMALVILVLALLLRQPNLPEGTTPSGISSSIAKPEPAPRALFAVRLTHAG